MAVKICIVVICVEKPCIMECGLLLFEDRSRSIKSSRACGRVSGSAASTQKFQGTSCRECPRNLLLKHLTRLRALEYFWELDGSLTR